MIMFKANESEKVTEPAELQEDFRKTSGRLQEGIPEFAQKTIDFIKENPKITVEELAVKLGLSERTILSHIALLKNLNLIKRVGGKTYGHWEIISDSGKKI